MGQKDAVPDQLDSELQANDYHVHSVQNDEQTGADVVQRYEVFVQQVQTQVGQSTRA